jgi:hypothetical protein
MILGQATTGSQKFSSAVFILFDAQHAKAKRFISVSCKRMDASNATSKAASVRMFGLSAIL